MLFRQTKTHQDHHPSVFLSPYITLEFVASTRVSSRWTNRSSTLLCRVRLLTRRIVLRLASLSRACVCVCVCVCVSVCWVREWMLMMMMLRWRCKKGKEKDVRDEREEIIVFVCVWGWVGRWMLCSGTLDVSMGDGCMCLPVCTAWMWVWRGGWGYGGWGYAGPCSPCQHLSPA